MQHSKKIFLAIGIVLAAIGFALSQQESHTLEQLGNFTFRLSNIILFGLVIWHFFGSKLRGFFEGRSKGIADQLSSLETRKAEAQVRLSSIESRISSLDQERQSILETYRKQGEILEKEIIDQANRTAGQIIEQAKATAQSEIDNAIEELRAQLADEIIAAAEKALAKKLTPAEQAKLVDKYLTRVVLN